MVGHDGDGAAAASTSIYFSKLFVASTVGEEEEDGYSL